jgi:hypothetical protein
MENVDARLTALEVAVSDLRALVAQLENRLTAERTRIRTMRHTLQCPSCTGRRILHVRTIHEASDSGLAPLALNTQFDGWTGVKPGDPLQAYVCRNCGLLEWHATGHRSLTADGTDIVELVGEDGAPPQGEPYR